LSAERAGLVGQDFVFDDSALAQAVDLPAAFIEFAGWERRTAGVAGANPEDILGEIPNLVSGVPDWQLELALGGAGGMAMATSNKVFSGVGEGDV